MKRWAAIVLLAGAWLHDGIVGAEWKNRALLAEARALAAESRAERAERWAEAVETEAGMWMEGMGEGR